MEKSSIELDNETFNANAYKVKGYPGVAWSVLGWETRSNEDTEWTCGDYSSNFFLHEQDGRFGRVYVYKREAIVVLARIKIQFGVQAEIVPYKKPTTT
jgi:hypothetical protein